ncbi:ArsR/SmtB family transcription factor [Micromonospora aurantiaca (nom. illeg.)]|uniref:ArsR/SmtB family transcription factor n=1 Tax=Micromonospora aurantiaca (nom. illeg.) TaxID=47850 RepID=UPI00160E5C9C|nr:helix-turn-helix domain-containing protein [Micromonospora aurantiaca]MBC9001880.1 helix-turn-helix transcriptional regulator [Micromonospora aurantiaca]
MEEKKRPEERAVRIDHRQVRALAQPLRMRLIGALRVAGPSTATALAEMLGTNSGATSYHLRQLAEVGLVVEDPNLGTGRQRYWRAAHDVTNWESSDFDDDPDSRAAIEWLEADYVRFFAGHAERWFSQRHQWGPAWRDAFGMGDFFMRIPVSRLEAIKEEVFALFERHRDETDPDDPDAETVQLYLAALPMDAAFPRPAPPSTEEKP